MYIIPFHTKKCFDFIRKNIRGIIDSIQFIYTIKAEYAFEISK